MGKYGLIGGKLGHSFSLGIHEQCFRVLEEKSTYELIETPPERLEDTLKRFADERYGGINVTIPHKKAVMKYLDGISPEADSIGAVNTIKFTDGKLYGYNTDYDGFGMMLRRFDVDIDGKDVYVLGTGGASNAVSAYCRNNGAKVTLVSRTASAKAIDYLEFERVATGGVLVNCTPVGMYPDVDNTPTKHVNCFDAVVDVIYNPTMTKLLTLAEDNGIKAINGLYMLVAQAVRAEEIWHNAKFDEDVVERIYQYTVKKLNS